MEIWGGFILDVIWFGTIMLVMTRTKVKCYFAAAASDNAVLYRS